MQTQETDVTPLIDLLTAVCPSLKGEIEEHADRPMSSENPWNMFLSAYRKGDDQKAARMLGWIIINRTRRLAHPDLLLTAKASCATAFTCLTAFSSHEWPEFSPGMIKTHRMLTECFVSCLLLQEQPTRQDLEICMYFTGRGGEQAVNDAFAAALAAHGVSASARILIDDCDAPEAVRRMAKAAPTRNEDSSASA